VGEVEGLGEKEANKRKCERANRRERERDRYNVK
jgi:hypothetical protein